MAPPMPMELYSDCTVHDPLAESDPLNEFFDFDRLGRDYDPSVTDASMTSGSASDSPSENTRSTAIDSSEVTSNAPSSDLDQDELMQDADANSRDHGSTPLLIPVLSDKHKEPNVTRRPATLPRTGRLMAPATSVHPRQPRAIAPKLDPGPQPLAITPWGHRSPPARLQVPQGKPPRARTVHDPKKVAGVRAVTACLHCSLQKLPCDVEGPCKKCSKWDPDNDSRVCIRPGKLDAILQSGRGSMVDGGRWVPQSYTVVKTIDERTPVEPQIDITVHLSQHDSHGLAIAVSQHADGNFRIINRPSAFEDNVLTWLKGELGKAPADNFQRYVDSFLCLYSQRSCVEKRALVDSVLKMSSLWRLISARELWHANGPVARQCGSQLASVVAELRTFAQLQMRLAEEKAIEAICALNKQGLNADNSDTPAVWASLWSVILVYRQAVQMAESDPRAFKDGFGVVTRRLLDALIVTLADHFRTRKTQEAVDSEHQSSFLGHADVMLAYESARSERRNSYQQLPKSRLYGDDLIDRHVVQNEHKALMRSISKCNKQKTVELVLPTQLGSCL